MAGNDSDRNIAKKMILNKKGKERKEAREALVRKQAALQRDREIADMVEILKMQSGAGLRLVQRWISKTKLFNRSMSGDSWVYYNLGKQDLGKEFLFDVLAADETITLKALTAEMLDDPMKLLKMLNSEKGE